MKRYICAAIAALSLTAGAAGGDLYAGNGDFNPVPSAWKWLGKNEIAFSYDGTFRDSLSFVLNAAKGKTVKNVPAVADRLPERRSGTCVPDDAVNPTWAPDSSRVAFTRGGDLYVCNPATGEETRLTFDGTDLILNGYASWVYYEEIFGRPSRYRAFWWSPDGKKIGWYRFDNTDVPLFPIYSPFGQDGTLRETRYPKAGETNPEVRIGMMDVEAACSGRPETVWADFEYGQDGYFGIPFWSADSRNFFVASMPRRQNTLDLYAVDASDGSKKHVYHEESDTWLDWIEDAVFAEKGLYMVRRFETGWEQIYFLSYDGNVLRRLTDGPNWGMSIVRVDERKGDIYFTAKRDSRIRPALYAVGASGKISALTDSEYTVSGVSFSPDGKYFAASLSNSRTPVKVIVAETAGAAKGKKGSALTVADMASESFYADSYALPREVWITTEDGFELPALVVLPKDFDPSVKYPVHVDIYGGPNTPLVRDRWVTPGAASQWWSENGIIQVTADCRAAGHNGRAGTDMVFRNLTEWPVRDFIAWADYLKSLPYVDGEKIGVEGFSFGGTMTSMLLFRASDSYHYGIAGGGVYDWRLYDSHYTERFMETPQANPDGYDAACVLKYVPEYPVENDGKFRGTEPVMLKLTHGTGDDNVHFQNTLQLVDELQRHGRKFEFMIYPDGMHGYRGYQGEHFLRENREFWLKYLKRERD